jgi:tetratricopeptide (TPR) repeat protein
MLALDRFDTAAAEERFRKVLERDPTNGDAHYYLALTHAERGDLLKARRHAYRLLPSAEKFRRRNYLLGLLALKTGEIEEAREKLRAAMQEASDDVSVRQAWAYVLRLSGRAMEAEAEWSAILDVDPTNAFARAEELQARGAAAGRDAEGLFHRACARHPQGYLELAAEYIRLSAWTEAAWVLERGIGEAARQESEPDPLLQYYRAWAARMQSQPEAARRALEAAGRHSLELEIYPFRFEDVPVLKFALQENAQDANAATLLGILLYSKGRSEEAAALWASAVKARPSHFPALRNLGLAQFVGGRRSEGLSALTEAARLNPRHVATVLLVASLNARLGRPEAARDVFQQALRAAPGNDILTERLAAVESQLGNNSRALELLDSHTFQPTHQSYGLLHLYRALRLVLAAETAAKGDFQGALRHVASAARPSANLGVDDFATVASSRLLVFEALLHEARGDGAAARRAWSEAASTRDDDVEGEGLFRALALHRIGESAKAAGWFREFEAVNEMRKKDNSLDVRTHAFSMAAFYSVFSGDDKAAAENFRRSVEMNQSYAYGRQALAWLDAGLLKGLRR